MRLMLNLVPVTFEADDCPTKPTDQIAAHIITAITVWANIHSPLAFLAPWTIVDDRLIELGRELKWLSAHAPLNNHAANGVYDFAHYQRGGGDALWASAIGVMARRHLERNFSFELAGTPFQLASQPHADTDARGYKPCGIDEDLQPLYVQAVIIKYWLDRLERDDKLRDLVEGHQLTHAGVVLQGAAGQLAKRHVTLNVPNSCRIRRFAQEEALVLWLNNIALAATAYGQALADVA